MGQILNSNTQLCMRKVWKEARKILPGPCEDWRLFWFPFTEYQILLHPQQEEKQASLK